jgi:general secretion pathway protein N
MADPAAAPAPVPAPAAPPERPSLTLVGTIIGQGDKNVDKIAIFFNPATKTTIRLRLGEAENGWVLRSGRGPRDGAREGPPQLHPDAPRAR